MGNHNRAAFGRETTTNDVLEGIELSGQLVLVTGGSSGLGAETARALASKGAKVVITARNLPKGEQVAENIRTSTGNAAVEVMALELGSFAKIRTFAEAFLAKYDSLDVLINNAGVMACPFIKTEDGFEMQFGTNHLGHFLLTGLLMPALLNGTPARIVALSSRGHRFAPVDFEDIHFEKRPYHPWVSYGQSKTANILHAVELERRYGARGVHAYAVHPGAIPTELSRHMSQDELEQLAASLDFIKTVEQGAATSVYAATAPELGRTWWFLSL